MFLSIKKEASKELRKLISECKGGSIYHSNRDRVVKKDSVYFQTMTVPLVV